MKHEKNMGALYSGTLAEIWVHQNPTLYDINPGRMMFAASDERQ